MGAFKGKLNKNQPVHGRNTVYLQRLCGNPITCMCPGAHAVADGSTTTYAEVLSDRDLLGAVDDDAAWHVPTPYDQLCALHARVMEELAQREQS